MFTASMHSYGLLHHINHEGTHPIRAPPHPYAPQPQSAPRWESTCLHYGGQGSIHVAAPNPAVAAMRYVDVAKANWHWRVVEHDDAHHLHVHKCARTVMAASPKGPEAECPSPSMLHMHGHIWGAMTCPKVHERASDQIGDIYSSYICLLRRLFLASDCLLAHRAYMHVWIGRFTITSGFVVLQLAVGLWRGQLSSRTGQPKSSNHAWFILEKCTIR